MNFEESMIIRKYMWKEYHEKDMKFTIDMIEKGIYNIIKDDEECCFRCTCSICQGYMKSGYYKLEEDNSPVCEECGDKFRTEEEKNEEMEYRKAWKERIIRNPGRIDDKEPIGDVQRIALNGVIEIHKLNYGDMCKEAFDSVGLDKDVPAVDDLTYYEAVEVIKYINDKVRENNYDNI